MAITPDECAAWKVEFKQDVQAAMDAKLKAEIEAYGRALKPVVLPPFFAKIARRVGADPALWVESKPLPLTGKT